MNNNKKKFNIQNITKDLLDTLEPWEKDEIVQKRHQWLKKQRNQDKKYIVTKPLQKKHSFLFKRRMGKRYYILSKVYRQKHSFHKRDVKAHWKEMKEQLKIDYNFFG